MTIRRRENWGEPGEVPSDARAVSTDAELAETMARGHSCVLEGGDLFRTLGGVNGGVNGSRRRTPVRRSEPRLGTRFVIDLMRVVIDEGPVLSAAASVIVRRRWIEGGVLRGPLHVVMNAEFVGRRDVVPRGHPNDGRVECLEVRSEMGTRQRLRAWRRSVDGTHLPHPSIDVRSVESVRIGPGVLLVDGRRFGRVSRVEVSVEADAGEVWLPRET